MDSIKPMIDVCFVPEKQNNVKCEEYNLMIEQMIYQMIIIATRYGFNDFVQWFISHHKITLTSDDIDHLINICALIDVTDNQCVNDFLSSNIDNQWIPIKDQKTQVIDTQDRVNLLKYFCDDKKLSTQQITAMFINSCVHNITHMLNFIDSMDYEIDYLTILDLPVDDVFWYKVSVMHDKKYILILMDMIKTRDRDIDMAKFFVTECYQDRIDPDFQFNQHAFFDTRIFLRPCDESLQKIIEYYYNENKKLDLVKWFIINKFLSCDDIAHCMLPCISMNDINELIQLIETLWQKNVGDNDNVEDNMIPGIFLCININTLTRVFENQDHNVIQWIVDQSSGPGTDHVFFQFACAKNLVSCAIKLLKSGNITETGIYMGMCAATISNNLCIVKKLFKSINRTRPDRIKNIFRLSASMSTTGAEDGNFWTKEARYHDRYKAGVYEWLLENYKQ